MKKKLLTSCEKSLILISSFICFNISCQEKNNRDEETKVVTTQVISNEVSFLFMGDFMQHGPQIDAARDSNGNYNYDHYFEYTNSLINGVDFAIANLEVTLAGAPYRGYPRFCAPDEYALSIKKAGFDILTTANNHSNDRNSEGLIRTISLLDSFSITHLGTYVDSKERQKNYPLIIEKDKIKIALLNYTYGTNGLATKYPNIVNMIEQETIQKDIINAQKLKSDKIIVITHWGSEYSSFPDSYQKKWGEWLLDNGAEIVIGGHPHWVQPIEYRKDSLNNEKLIVWSLGNIISNQRREHTDGGSSLQFTFYRDSVGEVKLKDIGYHLHWVWLHTEDNQKKYQILPLSKLDQMNLPMNEKSKKELNKFIQNERTLYKENNIMVPEYQYNQKTDSYYLE